MDKKNKSKLIIDSIAFIGIALLMCLLAYFHIHELKYGKPYLYIIPITVALLIIFFIATFAVSKLIGPYREKGETVLPFWVYFADMIICQNIFDFFNNKAEHIVDTATDVFTGTYQIIGLFIVCFMLIIVNTKIMSCFENKYRNKKKAKI